MWPNNAKFKSIELSLADWQQVGEGGNGKTYVNPAAPAEILKVNNARLSTLEAVTHEYDISKAVTCLGISVPEGTGCSHGDFQTGNLIQAGENYYWIDLDRFAYGDPMFDIGHLFLICHLYAPMKRVQDIFHMTLDQFNRFWDAFAKEYTAQEDHSEFDALAGKFAAVDVILRTVFHQPTFVEKLFFGIQVRKLVKLFFNYYEHLRNHKTGRLYPDWRGRYSPSLQSRL